MLKAKTERGALQRVKARKFCAHWLITKRVLRSLLRKRLVVPCGFYSVCLPENKPTLPIAISYHHPERTFDEH